MILFKININIKEFERLKEKKEELKKGIIN